MNLLFSSAPQGQPQLDLYVSGFPAVHLLTFKPDASEPGRLTVRDSAGMLLGEEDLAGAQSCSKLGAWTVSWLESRALRIDGVIHQVPPAPGAAEPTPTGLFPYTAQNHTFGGSLPHYLLTTPTIDVDAVMHELAPPPACRSAKARVRCGACASI